MDVKQLGKFGPAHSAVVFGFCLFCLYLIGRADEFLAAQRKWCFSLPKKAPCLVSVRSLWVSVSGIVYFILFFLLLSLAKIKYQLRGRMFLAPWRKNSTVCCFSPVQVSVTLHHRKPEARKCVSVSVCFVFR